jgi:hypothetical protein
VPFAAQVKIKEGFDSAFGRSNVFWKVTNKSMLPLETLMCQLRQWHLLFTHEMGLPDR